MKFLLVILLLAFSLSSCNLAQEPGGPPIGYPGTPKK